MKTAIYYPRMKSIIFYKEGRIFAGIWGNGARRKFWRLVRNGEFPKISLRKSIN